MPYKDTAPQTFIMISILNRLYRLLVQFQICIIKTSIGLDLNSGICVGGFLSESRKQTKEYQ